MIQSSTNIQSLRIQDKGAPTNQPINVDNADADAAYVPVVALDVRLASASSDDATR